MFVLMHQYDQAPGIAGPQSTFPYRAAVLPQGQAESVTRAAVIWLVRVSRARDGTACHKGRVTFDNLMTIRVSYHATKLHQHNAMSVPTSQAHCVPCAAVSKSGDA